jgi:hypothetical protein
LLRSIGERSFPDREKYGDPFLGAHLASRQRIRLIGFLEAFENANGLLHTYILPPQVDSMIYFSSTGAFTEFPRIRRSLRSRAYRSVFNSFDDLLDYLRV